MKPPAGFTLPVRPNKNRMRRCAPVRSCQGDSSGSFANSGHFGKSGRVDDSDLLRKLRFIFGGGEIRNFAGSCYLGELVGAGNLGLGVCGLGIQLRMAGEVVGVAHIELYYPTIVVKSRGVA